MSTFSFLEHKISFVTAAECPEGLVHHDCFHHSCEQTCTSIRSGQSSCPPLQVIQIHPSLPFFLLQSGVCFPGCFCPSGLVREGDACIEPSHCSNCVCRYFSMHCHLLLFLQAEIWSWLLHFRREECKTKTRQGASFLVLISPIPILETDLHSGHPSKPKRRVRLLSESVHSGLLWQGET